MNGVNCRGENPGSETIQVRVAAGFKLHLDVASQVTGLTRPELLRRAFDLYYSRLRRDYELPK